MLGGDGAAKCLLLYSAGGRKVALEADMIAHWASYHGSESLVPMFQCLLEMELF